MTSYVRKIKLFLLGLAHALLIPALVFSQPAERRISKSEYIDQYKDDAIEEMQAHGIPASITLAQGMLESGDGNSPLARYANNHFGIKCHSGWEGKTFYQDDDKKNECFRKYHTVRESYRDHSEFLATRSRYAPLFELSKTDYKAWAYGLKKAGYATNPKYPELLIRIIEENNLHQYDLAETVAKRKIKTRQAKKERPVASASPSSSRAVMLSGNRVKYVVAGDEDSFTSIAKSCGVELWQIYKYNELEKGAQCAPGTPVYLQPKRRKGSVEQHTVRVGDTVKSVAQQYGMKEKFLRKYNHIEGDAIQAGQVLYLRGKAPR